MRIVYSRGDKQVVEADIAEWNDDNCVKVFFDRNSIESIRSTHNDKKVIINFHSGDSVIVKSCYIRALEVFTQTV